MSTRIGMYPGGPRGAAPGTEIHGSPHLMRVEEIEELIGRRSSCHRQRNRRKHLIVALVLGTVLAGSFGLVVGRSAHTTPEELANEVVAKQNPEAGLSKQVNRTLLELWRMEEVEYARSRRGR
ncbi:MAG: hypothetical protein ACC682_15300 [Gemmatimonadota bacterium]